jgi:hypothetical protein
MVNKLSNVGPLDPDISAGMEIHTMGRATFSQLDDIKATDPNMSPRGACRGEGGVLAAPN